MNTPDIEIQLVVTDHCVIAYWIKEPDLVVTGKDVAEALQRIAELKQYDDEICHHMELNKILASLKVKFPV